MSLRNMLTPRIDSNKHNNNSDIMKRPTTEITREWIRDLAQHQSTTKKRRTKSYFVKAQQEQYPELPSTSNSPLHQSQLSLLVLSTTKEKTHLPMLSADVESAPQSPIALLTPSSELADDSSAWDEEVLTEDLEEYDDEDEEECGLMLQQPAVVSYIPFRPPSVHLTLEEQLFDAVSRPEDTGLDVMCSLMERVTCKDINQIRNKRYQNCSLLHTAARFNNIQCMQLLFERGADINSKDGLQATPLHYACSRNSQEAVLLLLNNQANVNAKCVYETFPLLMALKNYQLETVKILLMNKADIHLKSSRGDTCLHIAARQGYLRRCRFLIEECGASVSRLNRENEHVLFSALGHYSVTHYLCTTITSYKTLTKLVTSTNSSGRTLFQEAVYNNHLESLLVILQSLMKTATNEAESKSAVDAFIHQRLNELDPNDGKALIHMAVTKNCHRIVKFLSLCSEVEIDKRDKSKFTALDYALEMKDNELCEILVNVGKVELNKKMKKQIEQIGIQVNSEITTASPKSFSLKTIKKSTSDLLNRLNI